MSTETTFYSEADSEIAGSLLRAKPMAKTTIRHRELLSNREKRTVLDFAILKLVMFIGFWVIASSSIRFSDTAYGWIVGGSALAAFVLIELFRVTQGFFLIACTRFAKNPIPWTPQPGLRIAILTTIVPWKEPIKIVERTLQAMKQIRYDGQVDVWILDEGDSARVKSMAASLGVRHFSRRGKPQYNQPTGQFSKTKAGNHNSWRAEHEQDYDIVAQMDPDHVPFPNFLERTVGYFRDPNVGFVVAPQVYGNLGQCFVARGAAEHAYIFHGVVQRAGGVIGSPIMVGTNHLYRTKAFHQMGGYQDSIIEDHLTSATIHGLRNPETGFWQ